MPKAHNAIAKLFYCSPHKTTTLLATHCIQLLNHNKATRVKTTRSVRRRTRRAIRIAQEEEAAATRCDDKK